MLRVSTVQRLQPAGYTVLGWTVPDIDRAVRELVDRGVMFQKYDGLPQDEQGVWTAPGGARVAWFKDPDGNTLSVTEHTPSGKAARPRRAPAPRKKPAPRGSRRTVRR
jgi:hypothetical protein